MPARTVVVRAGQPSGLIKGHRSDSRETPALEGRHGESGFSGCRT